MNITNSHSDDENFNEIVSLDFADESEEIAEENQLSIKDDIINPNIKNSIQHLEQNYLFNTDKHFNEENLLDDYKIEENKSELHSFTYIIDKEDNLNLGEDISELNFELKNNNEFINMSRFDEASRAGFINHNDNQYKVKNNYPNNLIRLESIEIKQENFNIENNNCSPINKYKNSNNLIIENEEEVINNNVDNDDPIKFELIEENNLSKLDFKRKEHNKDDKFSFGNINFNFNKNININNYKNKICTQNILAFKENDEELIKTYNFVKKLKGFNKFLKNKSNKENIKINEKTKLTNYKIIPTNVINTINIKTSKITKNNLEYSTEVNIKNKTTSQEIEKLKEKLKLKEEIIISFEEEINSLKLSNKNEMINLKEKLEKEKTILSNKLTESYMIQNKLKNEISDQSEIIENLKLEKDKFKNINSDENSNLKNQIENIKMELNIQNNKKNERIIELEELNKSLEHELNEFKLRTQNEINNLKDNKKNYDSFKSNYYEIKNQYELINMKYQSISDENFNIKRDLLLYEKEIKNKNEIIEKLRREFIDANKKGYLSEISGSNLNLNLNLNNIIKGGRDSFETENNNYDDDFKYNNDNIQKKNIIKNKSGRNDPYEKHLEDFNKTTPNDYNVNKSISNREDKIKSIENKMYDMNQERGRVELELNKMPQFPKKRDQISKRKELEDMIDNYGRELAQMKQELNVIKREL